MADVAPTVYTYIVTAAFADIYGRPGLVYAQRQLVTIVSLATQGDVQNHVRTHVNGALNIDIPPAVVIGALVDTLPLADATNIIDSVEVALDVFDERGITPEWSASQAW